MLKKERQINVWIIRIIILLSLILGSIYLLNGFPTITGNTIIAQQDIPQNDSRVIGSLFIAQSFLLTILSRNRERKGQAAMEFLLTYGWVILAGLIALGVFIYIVGFSRSAIPSQEFVLDPPFYGNGYNYAFPTDFTSKAELGIKNIGPAGYNVEKTYLSGCGLNNSLVYIEAGSTKTVSVKCNTLIPNNLKGSVKIKYRIPGATFTQDSGGTIAPPLKKTVQVGGNAVSCTAPSACGASGMYTYSCVTGAVTEYYWSNCVTSHAETIMTFASQGQTVPINTLVTVQVHFSDLNGFAQGGLPIEIFLGNPDGTLSPQGSTSADPSGNAVFGPFTQNVAGTWKVLFRNAADGSLDSSRVTFQ